jgi:hypothetical protein
MGKYDTTIREVLQEGCSAFLRAIGIESPLSPLPFKLPRVTAREVDFVGEDENGVVHHVEFQAVNDPIMHARMLVYAGQIGERVMRMRRPSVVMRNKRRPEAVQFPDIRSTMVYVGRRPMSMPTAIERGPTLDFRFASRDARDLDADALLASPEIGDALMAVLCREGTKPDKVRKILERIEGAEAFRRDRDYGRLLILAELRDASRVVDTELKRMNIQVNLDNIPRVREHAKQARIDMLTTMLAGKFGDEVKETDVAGRLAKMEVKQLEAVAVRLLKVDDIDEVLDGSSSKEKLEADPKR